MRCLIEVVHQFVYNMAICGRIKSNYFKARDRVSGVRSTSTTGTSEDDDGIEVIEQEMEGGDGKRVRVVRDAIAQFDQTGELLTLFDDESVDDIKRRRQLLYKIIQIIDENRME